MLVGSRVLAALWTATGICPHGAVRGTRLWGVDLDAIGDAPLLRQVEAIETILVEDRALDALLGVLPAVELPGCYVGAGAVAAAVWNRRFRLPPGTGVKDYDVVYYDPTDLSAEAERTVEAAVAALAPAGVEVDVTNEARVHLWYEERFGRAIEQYVSSEAAIATWPSTATSVGLRRSGQQLSVCAPYGLRDLFLGIVRPNLTLVSRELYESKVTRWKATWPSLTTLPW
jgi:hypothetical protein